jgi:cytochrome c biogenesis protein CcdA/glutaredoxin
MIKMTQEKKARYSILFLAIFLALFLFGYDSSLGATELIFFYEKGCPYSARINAFLQQRIKPHYPVEVKAFEIHEPANARLMIDLANIYGANDILKNGVPAVFIGAEAFQGSSRVVQREIEGATRVAIRNRAPSPLSQLLEESPEIKSNTRITLPVVIGAAAASALNPCSGAVFVLLLGTILVVSRRRKAVLGAGFSFTAASFISYFFIGLGFFTVVQGSGIQHYAFIAVAILAVLIGLWNAKDFFWRKSKLPELPESWQPLIKRSTSRVTPVLAASFIGFAASLFLLPCTSGPYVVIIGMLGSIATRMQAIWLLLLYNTIFVLPFIAITLVVGLGFSTATKLEKWRVERLRRFRLITGLLMLALGATLIVLLLLGLI